MLKPYQEVGVEWMLDRLRKNNFAWIADEQGLGKTLQIITTVKQRTDVKDIIVICPAIAKISWEKEIEKWDPDASTSPMEMQDIVLSGSDRRCYHIHSYDKISRDDNLTASLKDLAELESSMVVLDEHHYLKSFASKRTQRIFGVTQGIATVARRYGAGVIAASGTPAPDWPVDIYPLAQVMADEVTLAPNGERMSYDQFWRRYHVVERMKGKLNHIEVTRSIRTDTIKQLWQRTKPVLLRRTKEQVAKDIPPLVWGFGEIHAPRQKLYRAIKRRLDEKGDTLLALELIEIRLRQGQISADQALEELGDIPHLSVVMQAVAEIKVASLSSTIESSWTALTAPRRLVFYVHRDIGDELQSKIDDTLLHNPQRRPWARIDGATSQKARQLIMNDFQDGRYQGILGQIKAMGTAITLTKATAVEYVETSFTPADVAQSAARAHRIGTTHRVTATIWRLTDTFDDMIQRIVTDKASAVAGLTNEGAQHDE